MWVIASKNVGMLCEDRKDIKLYKDTRYWYARLFAKTWFDKIDKMDKDLLKRLKKLLTNHTIIGEYCGNYFLTFH